MLKKPIKDINIDPNKLINKRIVSSTLANIIRQPLIRVLTVIGSVVVARVLGPNGLAVIAAITANTNTIVSFMDFGLSSSISKILPDLSVEYGREKALLSIKKIFYIKLLFVYIGFLIFFLLDRTNILNFKNNFEYSFWFYPIVGINLFLSTIATFKKTELIASLRMSELAKIQIAVAFLSPVLIICATLIWSNPYIIATTQLILVLIEIIFLKLLPGYDLDKQKINTKEINFYQLFKKIRKYISVDYIIYIFNSFVFGLPLTLYILSALDVDAHIIGLASVTIAISKLGQEMANVPLGNLRVPVMARMIAENEYGKFLKVQRIMTLLIIISSGVLAIGMITMVVPIFDQMYGEKYYEAIRWGVPLSIVALFFNIFSMGNSTIRQVEKYTPVIVGLCASAIFIIFGNLTIINCIDAQLWPPAVICISIVGRGVFVVITDLWTDFILFKWTGTIIKIKSIISLGFIIFIAHIMVKFFILQTFYFNKNIFFISCINLNIFIISTFAFLLLLKFLGCLEKDILIVFQSLAPNRIKWLFKILMNQ